MVWHFAGTVSSSRMAHLRNAPTFAEIVGYSANTATIRCAHIEQSRDAPGHARLIATIRLSPESFDWFFNSEQGYRGAYFTSPAIGDACNRNFIAAFASVLLEYATGCGLDTRVASLSLNGHWSKVWLAEFRDRPLCPNCAGEWTAPRGSEPDILNGRWNLSSSPLARFGVTAPSLSQVRVMGAFVNEDGLEYVAEHKRARGNDVHYFGWS